MTTLEKLTKIRSLMKEKGIDGYIIPSSDPHISEYLPKHYQCVLWTSGFSGSAGTLVITQDFAGLWTDSRYFVQAKEQLKNSGFELVKLKTQGIAEYIDWLADVLPKKSIIAFDGNLSSLQVSDAIKKVLVPLGFKINGHVDLLESIWHDRPKLPKENAYLLSENITGESSTNKINRIKNILTQKNVTSHLISSLDDIAWVLNIRGTDVQCNPVTLSFLYISIHENILFIDKQKINDSTSAELVNNNIAIRDYHEVKDFLSKLDNKNTILIDPKRTCYSIYDSIPKNVKIIEDINPSTRMKSIKNGVEIKNEREAMINDGIALTKFFKWLEENVEKGNLSEINIAEYLRDLRAKLPGFKDISFSTIAGYKEHGALPHYNAEEHSNFILEQEGLLLVDSGGQYEKGTTDITRVISLGKATTREKEDYTIVLKGMIEGSAAIFPKGTRGYQIDAITRRPIWSTLRNYAHGTGHGVGFFLNVHEGPQVFNPSNIDIPIEPGMITSIEPGLYREGEYGIRIENLVLAKDFESNQFGEFMNFETLSLCYIETSLIERTILDQVHINWLNDYHQEVYNLLSEKLDEDELIWLREKTKAIEI